MYHNPDTGIPCAFEAGMVNTDAQERDLVLEKLVEIGEEIERTMDELTDEAAAKLDAWLFGE